MKIIFRTTSFAVIFAFLIALSQTAAGGNYEEFISYEKSLKGAMSSRNGNNACIMRDVSATFFLLHKVEKILDSSQEIFYINKAYKMLLEEGLSPDKDAMRKLKEISIYVHSTDLNNEKFLKFTKGQYLLCMKEKRKFLVGKE